MRARRMAAVAVLLAMTASACGGDDSATSDAAQATAATDVRCEPAPAGSESVQPLPPWSAGVQRDLQLQIGRANTVRPTPDGMSLTPVTLTVEADEDDGWSFVWEASPTLLDDLALPEAALEAAVPVLEDVPRQRVAYRLSEAGVWLGVTNHDEIRDAVIDTMDVLAEIMGPAESGAMLQVRALFTSLPDDNLAAMFAEEPQVLHVFEGLELFLGEPLLFDDLLPNNFGGEAFPATTAFEVTDMVDDDGCVTIEMRVIPDPDVFVEILFETLQQTFPAGTPDEDIEELAGTFEIENLIVGQYDVSTGYFVRLTATQRVSDGNDERIDTKIITDVTAG